MEPFDIVIIVCLFILAVIGGYLVVTSGILKGIIGITVFVVASKVLNICLQYDDESEDGEDNQ